MCANNELPPDDHGRSISAVRVEAEMQTPSKKGDIPLEFADGTDVEAEGKPFLPGDSIQKIIRLNLNEPGQHVLAVTVTYTETQLSEDGGAAGGRLRTFRKLYQFKATTLIGVKTKAGDVKAPKSGLERYALEAQLENLGERTVTLEVRCCSHQHVKTMLISLCRLLMLRPKHHSRARLSIGTFSVPVQIHHTRPSFIPVKSYKLRFCLRDKKSNLLCLRHQKGPFLDSSIFNGEALWVIEGLLARLGCQVVHDNLQG